MYMFMIPKLLNTLYYTKTVEPQEQRVCFGNKCYP